MKQRDHVAPPSGPAEDVLIDSLNTTDSPRTAGEDMEHVRALAEASQKWPPIIVHCVTRWVVDGRHRVRAAQLRGQDTIAARYFDGDEAAAFVLAVRMNVQGERSLTLADRKAAAARIVVSHAHWSDRLIASVIGLSPGTVSEVRKKSADAQLSTDVRVGRDGRARPTNIDERKLVARNALLSDPTLSLRQVARTAGISPETVRVIRTDLFGETGRANQLMRDTSDEDASDAKSRPPQANSSVMDNLKVDPSLRFTDSGRVLLRLLEVHGMGRRMWSSGVTNVPGHCLPAIAHMAREYAVFWQWLANRLSCDVNGPR